MMKLSLLVLVSLMAFAPTTSAEESTVEISWGFDVSDASTTINVGDTVKWVWDQDSQPHDVVSGAGRSPDGLFESALQGQAMPLNEFSYTFDEAGVFEYFCTPHAAMVAVITVEAPATTSPTTTSPTAAPTATATAAPTTTATAAPTTTATDNCDYTVSKALDYTNADCSTLLLDGEFSAECCELALYLIECESTFADSFPEGTCDTAGEDDEGSETEEVEGTAELVLTEEAEGTAELVLTPDEGGTAAEVVDTAAEEVEETVAEEVEETQWEVQLTFVDWGYYTETIGVGLSAKEDACADVEGAYMATMADILGGEIMDLPDDEKTGITYAVGLGDIDLCVAADGSTSYNYIPNTTPFNYSPYLGGRRLLSDKQSYNPVYNPYYVPNVPYTVTAAPTPWTPAPGEWPTELYHFVDCPDSNIYVALCVTEELVEVGEESTGEEETEEELVPFWSEEECNGARYSTVCDALYNNGCAWVQLSFFGICSTRRTEAPTTASPTQSPVVPTPAPTSSPTITDYIPRASDEECGSLYTLYNCFRLYENGCKWTVFNFYTGQGVCSYDGTDAPTTASPTAEPTPVPTASPTTLSPTASPTTASPTTESPTAAPLQGSSALCESSPASTSQYWCSRLSEYGCEWNGSNPFYSFCYWEGTEAPTTASPTQSPVVPTPVPTSAPTVTSSPTSTPQASDEECGSLYTIYNCFEKYDNGCKWTVFNFYTGQGVCSYDGTDAPTTAAPTAEPTPVPTAAPTTPSPTAGPLQGSDELCASSPAATSAFWCAQLEDYGCAWEPTSYYSGNCVWEGTAAPTTASPTNAPTTASPTGQPTPVPTAAPLEGSTELCESSPAYSSEYWCDFLSTYGCAWKLTSWFTGNCYWEDATAAPTTMAPTSAPTEEPEVLQFSQYDCARLSYPGLCQYYTANGCTWETAWNGVQSCNSYDIAEDTDSPTEAPSVAPVTPTDSPTTAPTATPTDAPAMTAAPTMTDVEATMPPTGEDNLSFLPDGFDSCVDHCGYRTISCWCDDGCVETGDCCDNHADVCL